MEALTLSQIAYLLNTTSSSSAVVKGFSVDSRTLKSGELYIALKGEQVDGHQFLADVRAKGAIGALVSRHYTGTVEGLPLLHVDDPLNALQELAKQVLARRKALVIAISGSIGKTTTKEFTAAFLRTKYTVAASPGNNNSQIGIPLTILNHMKGDEDILVLEMGMTTPGNLARLVQIAPPEVAVLTNVALVHAQNFSSLEAIAWTKAELFSHAKTRLGILNRGIPDYAKIVNLGRSKKLSFSLSQPDADYWFDHENHTLHANTEDKIISLAHLKIPGKHNVNNVLAAAIIARHFNISWETINETIPLLKLPERRLEFIEKDEILFINDSYNASELSVKAALESLPTPEGEGRKIAVLGSMMELGKFSDECHQKVGEFALDHVDEVYCLGQECEPIYQVWQSAQKPVDLFLDRTELLKKLRSSLKPSDVVLLKGSRSKEMWKILEEI